MTEAGDRLRLLFDWASAQDAPRRLALWVTVALLLHGGAYLLLRVTYPPAAPARPPEAVLYLLPPGSAEEKRLAPFLDAADPALFAPEETHGLKMAAPSMPAYEPSYADAKPQLVPLPDNPARVLPPLLRDFGPVPVSEAPAAPAPPPAAATATQVEFSEPLAARAPREWPRRKFTTRPGDLLAPTKFLLAVAPDGRVLHVVKDGANDVLDDPASQYLMSLWFRRGPDSKVAWGTATFHWGLDVRREELRR